MTREEGIDSILSAVEAALARGDQSEAEHRLTEGLRADPENPALTRSLVRLLAGQQRFGEAADRLASLAEAGDRDTDLRVDLGRLLRLSGRTEQARAELTGVLASEPGHAGAAYTLAFLLRDAGRWSEAARVVEDHAAALDDPEALLKAAGFLWEVEAYGEAAGVLERVIERSSRDPRAWTLLGRARETLGEFEAALDAYRQALQLKRDLPAAWLRLTRLRRVIDPGDPELERLGEAAADPALSPESRACAGFALSKAWDELGHYERAFEHLVRANRLWPQRGEWSADAWAAEVTATTEAFPAIRNNKQPDSREPRPVFVVGMLRSGTTLLEQLLGAHPAVAARGELNWVREIASRLPDPGWPRGWHSVPPDERDRLRRLYLQHAIRSAGRIQAFVDKNPLNFRYLGMIAELFPEALLIHMRRDPRDVGLSLFQQAFEDPENAYAYDLDDIVAFYEGYEALMDHWSSLLGPRLRVIRYEDMVADPEGTAASVLGLLGLSPSDGAPGKGSGIRTASAWQARQPVHRRSVGRWKHYRALAPAFFSRLAPG